MGIGIGTSMAKTRRRTKADGDNDPLRYYNYRRGEYVEFPEPDPAEIAYGSGPGGFVLIQ